MMAQNVLSLARLAQGKRLEDQLPARPTKALSRHKSLRISRWRKLSSGRLSRALALLIVALAPTLPGAAAIAQGGPRVVERTAWTEEWDHAEQQWVRVDDSPASDGSTAYKAAEVFRARRGNVLVAETIIERPARLKAGASRAPDRHARIARFGPFRVIDGTRAALVASTDEASPQAFADMLASYPGLTEIEFVDAPGTSHDVANLALGRAIRAAGLATRVPAGGSARSGAVELFLAGTRRTIDTGALFAVHSWRDAHGREPADFTDDAPENRLYLDYYEEMGMTASEAHAFYAMTNSVPYDGALWLRCQDMAQWMAADYRT